MERKEAEQKTDSGIYTSCRYFMATSSSSDVQTTTAAAVDSSERIAEEFLSKADDYFRSEVKCRVGSCASPPCLVVHENDVRACFDSRLDASK